MEGSHLVMKGFLIAPESYWEASPDLIAKVCNGCGSSQARVDLVPDSFWWLDVTPACRAHDWMYHEGVNKHLADAVFLANMALLAAQGTKWLLIPRLHMACRYFLAVFFCGDSSFGKDK